MKRIEWFRLGAVVGFVACVAPLHAAVPDAAISLEGGAGSRSAFDPIWNGTELYRDDGAPILQDLDLTGRFHGQYHWADGDVADDDGWETRRLRVGLEARILHDFTLKAEITSTSDMDPFFNGFSNLAVQWHPDDAFMLTIGKQAPRFTWDYSTSSNLHPYVERSQLINEFAPDRAPGVSVQGNIRRLSYYAALFSNSPGTDVGREFGAYEGGGSYVLALGYDVSGFTRASAADVRLEYMHSDHNSRSTIYNRFDDGIATSLALREGRASLVSEVVCGLGGGRGDAVGLNLMPGWFVSEKLEIVARYQIAVSNGDTGLTSQRRYERAAGLPAGDLYQSAYAGFNYFLYGPRFRFMGGVEFADMNGRDTWTALLAVRVYWGPDARTAFPVNYPFAKR